MKAYRNLLIFLIVALVLSACNLPSAQPTEQVNPNAVFTAAAETVVAELTKSAPQNPTSPPATVPPSTNTPEAPTNTPQPAAATATTAPAAPVVLCDAGLFVTDVSIPDGTVFSAGGTFTKTWRIKNTGTCTWTSAYSLVFDSGNAMGGAASTPLSGTVAPGQTVDLSVNLQAPSGDNTYRGYWGLNNASGARVPVSNGRTFYVEIKVGTGSSSGGTPVSSNGKFAVTSVGFSVAASGACASRKYTVTATVSTNKAGDVTYTWVRSDGATGAVMSGTLNFSDAGSQTITFDWTFGGGNQWVDLYVDKPNHQQFGRAALNCP